MIRSVGIMDYTQRSNAMDVSDDNNMLNINGSDDPYYRYKMPAITTVFVNQKKGLTRWDNCATVAKSIYRTPAQLKKYMSKKLGVQSILEPTGAITFRGNIDASTLQKHLQDYIKADVLCRKCKSPETINGVCQSCGVKHI